MITPRQRLWLGAAIFYVGGIGVSLLMSSSPKPPRPHTSTVAHSVLCVAEADDAPTIVTPLGSLPQRNTPSTLAIANRFDRAVAMLTLASQATSKADWGLLLDSCTDQSLLEAKIVAAVWARRDPEQAAAHFASSSRSRSALAAASVMFTIWGETAPLESLVYLQRIPAPNAFLTCERHLFEQALTNAQPEAVEMAQRISRRLGHFAYNSVDPVEVKFTDSETLKSLLQAFRGYKGGELTTAIGARFAEVDPEKALDWLPSQSGLAQHTDEAFLDFYARDPERALAYAERQRPDRATQFQVAAVGRMAESDPEGARQWAEAHLKGRSRAQALESIFRQMARSNPVRATEVLDSIAHPLRRRYAANELLTQWLSQDPQTATAYLSSWPPENLPEGNRFYAMWSEADLNGAAQYLTGLPAAQQAPGFAKIVGEKFGRSGRWREGMGWVEGLTPTRRAEAIPELFSGISSSEIPEAFKAIDSISETDQRSTFQLALFEPWLYHDATAAQRWLRESVPAAMRDSWREAVEQNPRIANDRKKRLLSGLQ